LTARSFVGALNEASGHLGPTLMCVATGSLFAWVLAFLQVPQMVEGFVDGMNLSPTAVLIMIMLLFLIVGTFESGVASIIIFLPIVQPMANAAGLHPVHVGVIVCMTLAAGLITPPYGLCLYVAAKIGGISVERAFVSVLPWLALFISMVLVCIFFPQTVLYLPSLIAPQFMGV